MTDKLIIVESPSKANTISRFLGKDYNIKASMGHIRDLPEKELGIDKTTFEPKYKVSTDKRSVVADLKKAVKAADEVFLASDHDREGEAIAWHLMEALKLDEKKTRRIVFHEITKPAIIHSLENPLKIDKHLVDAQQARRILDRLVGFELSPVLWKKVKPALSAGRVQSVAVRLIVEREEEIKAFTATSWFKIIAEFLNKNNESFKAELNKKFDTQGEAEAFLKAIIGLDFTIESVEKKPGSKSPAPPFTTSTLQQEASRKLSYSVAQTMRVAQKLYEAGKITYMRTDSLNLSNLAIASAKDEIISRYGENYSRTRKFTTKSKGAQEAHEAIRPTDFSLSECTGDAQQKKLYELIWKRTIASQMANAKIEKTQVYLGNPAVSQKFVAKGEVILFDGFIKVYTESFDDGNGEENGKNILPKMEENQKLNYSEVTGTQRFTKAAARYTEASLVKKLEELGIGRPSTYAPTISTIQNRKYVVKESREGIKREFTQLILKDNQIETLTKTENTGYEKSKLFPTDIGGVVNKFLVEHFGNILDYNFTANIEKEFDEIADGKMNWQAMIKEFYTPFDNQIKETLETAKKSVGERKLGIDPASGKPLFVKIGRYGALAQIGETDKEDKPRFASLRPGQSIEDITFEEALELFKFPRNIGQFEDEDMTVAIGRFGPYVKHKSAFFSLNKEQDPGTITQEEAIILIEAKRKKDIENIIHSFNDGELRVLKGRFGPYISYKKKNFKIPKGEKPEDLSLEKCMEIIEKAPVTKKKFTRRTKK